MRSSLPGLKGAPLIFALLFLLFEPESASARPAREFKDQFMASYAEALSLAPGYLASLHDKFGGDDGLAALGVSMIFPEMVKFLHLGRLADAQKRGKAGGAPVSAELAEILPLPFGPFLMRPGSIERLDKSLPAALKEKLEIPKRDIRDPETQMDCLAALVLHLREKYPEMRGRPREELAFFSAAFSAGFWKSAKEIEAGQKDYSFPFGRKGSRERFSYSEVALLFYLENAELMGGRNTLPPSSGYWFGLSESDIAAALGSLAALGFEEGRIEGTESIFRMAKEGYLPLGIEPEELKKEYVCAKAVNRAFHFIYGGPGDLDFIRGVFGDAWNIPTNVRNAGGEILPWTESGMRELQPGDILGIRYTLSIFNSIKKAADFSHVALVLAVPEGGSPIILHSWKLPDYLSVSSDLWPLRVERLDRFLEDFEGLFSVKEIVRPVVSP